MKIIIDNLQFEYDLGVRLLKTKYTECFPGLEDVWDDISSMTFKEICEQIKNIEQRRVAINCLGINNLTKEINPKLIGEKTIPKQTLWVAPDGQLISKKYNDVYSLYEVDGSIWAKDVEKQRWQSNFDNVYYVKFKDTSTDREYMIWVDPYSVYDTNNPKDMRLFRSENNDFSKLINPIQAIAWTIQTNIATKDIEKIIRQGDCIMIKKKPNAKKGDVRHLTEKEYLTLLKEES